MWTYSVVRGISKERSDDDVTVSKREGEIRDIRHRAPVIKKGKTKVKHQDHREQHQTAS